MKIVTGNENATKADLAEMEKNLRSDMTELERNLRKDLATKTDLEGLRATTKTGFEELKTEIRYVHVSMENFRHDMINTLNGYFDVSAKDIVVKDHGARIVALEKDMSIVKTTLRRKYAKG